MHVPTPIKIRLVLLISQSYSSNFAVHVISIGNYTVREVLMKNRTRVWRNVYKYFAKHK